MNPIQSAAKRLHGSSRPALKLLAGFFVLMLLFTLLSRTASGLSTAEVDAVLPGQGSLRHEIKGTGTVEALGRTGIGLPQGLPIGSLRAGAGDLVKAGAPLASFDPDDIARLLAAMENELASLRLDRQEAESDGNALSDAEKALARLKSDQETAARRADEDVERTEKAYIEAQRSFERLYEQNEAYLNKTYRSQEGTVNDVDDSDLKLSAGASDAEREWTAAAKAARSEMLSAREAIQSAHKAFLAAVRDRETRRISGQRELADAEESAAKARENESEAQARARQKREALALSIQEKEEAVSQLKALQEAGGVLTSPSAGTVLSVKGEAGGLTPGGELFALSSDPEGSRVIWELPKSQAELLGVGDKVGILLKVGGSQTYVQGTISSVAPPTGEDETRYRVTVSLPEGSYQAGSSADLEIMKPSESYYLVLPLSALRTEGGRDYVYVLREKETVMGKELLAERVEVTVRDQDGDRMAVDAALSMDDQVVTSTTRSLTSGDRVKLAPKV